jgi:toxin FitB
MRRAFSMGSQRRTRWLLDTNILSELLKVNPDPIVSAWIDGQPRSSLFISSITVMEIRYGLSRMPAGARRSAREAAFNAAISADFNQRILPLDQQSADAAGLLAAAREAIGKPVRGNDTMIAGIALANRMGIATRNTSDFQNLDVPVLNPFDAQP